MWFCRFLLLSALSALSALSLPNIVFAAQDVAKYASLPYDVVYVRCPRAEEPVKWFDNRELLNWNGVNDIWLSASNNVYQQPGCDLVLHHSEPNYNGGLPIGDRGREEVLVNCDESDSTKAICTIADPNVSMDGKVVIYTKFLDTRNFVNNIDVLAAYQFTHSQTRVDLYPNGNGPNPYGGAWGRAVETPVPVFDSPGLIFKYDLATGIETQVSPNSEYFKGRAIPGKLPEWSVAFPVIDNGAVFMDENTIVFTSNRDSVLHKFKLFKMDIDGSNLELIGQRTMNQQLHPFALKDGRVSYTNFDPMIQKVANNQYSLFTIRTDGGNPFILAGKHDPSGSSYHFATQLSDGDIVSTLYYNRNNKGFGGFLRFPVDPPGPDFEHLGFDGTWREGAYMQPFSRVGEFDLTPFAQRSDFAAGKYKDTNDYWIHPSRTLAGDVKTITEGQDFFVNKSLITMSGKFSHPAAAPDNNLITTYAIGSVTSLNGAYAYPALEEVLERIGKDAGIWFFPLQANDKTPLQHVALDGQIIVDFPEYHEIMARAVVSYEAIYGVKKPGLLADGGKTENIAPIANLGLSDARLKKGEPYGLTGAATLYDRETRSLNGVPWAMTDGGGAMSGRTYMNLATSGADLAIYGNDEIAGVRVLLPLPSYPYNNYGGIEQWVGYQTHHMRIFGEFPVRKTLNGQVLLDASGNPDTSFVVKLPADTPFLFQSIDKNGMALDIETTSRTVHRGEQQFCGGCHVHTRVSLDPFNSVAKLDASPKERYELGSAWLFDSLDENGQPVSKRANVMYGEADLPGVTTRNSVEVFWDNGDPADVTEKVGVSQIFENRCKSCHGEGQSAQQLTGLRLDGDDRTYDLLIRNTYFREDGIRIGAGTKPGDGLYDVINETPETDRITRRGQCCTPSRWVSLNSARSSMLTWALYGERLDGRNPATGRPWGAEGEEIPADKQGLAGVLVDNTGKDLAEVWPRVGEHLAYVTEMPESEKRLISRWLDLGMPKRLIHVDNMRPVLTITPETDGNTISTIYLGLWDDSALDYSRFSVKRNGVEIMNGDNISGSPDVVTVALPVAIDVSNAATEEYAFEIWDKPYWIGSNTPANIANRKRRTISGLGLLRMAGAVVNSPPDSASAVATTEQNSSISFFPKVNDPDVGDSHFYAIVSQPANGFAEVANNKLVYQPNSGFLGQDSFEFTATDLSGASVQGLATITVIERINKAPSIKVLSLAGYQNQVLSGTPVVLDPDAGDSYTLSIVNSAASGEAQVSGNNVFYTPNTDFSGADSFVVRVTDAAGLFADGIVNVNVQMLSSTGKENVAPSDVSARIDVYSGQAATVLVSFLDPNIDDTHTLSIVSQPASGRASVVDDKLSYVSVAGFVGNDDFTFRVTDNGGLWGEGLASVVVNAAKVPDEPQIEPAEPQEPGPQVQPDPQIEPEPQAERDTLAGTNDIDPSAATVPPVLRANDGELGRKASFIGAFSLGEIGYFIGLMLLLRYCSVWRKYSVNYRV